MEGKIYFASYMLSTGVPFPTLWNHLSVRLLSLWHSIPWCALLEVRPSMKLFSLLLAVLFIIQCHARATHPTLDKVPNDAESDQQIKAEEEEYAALEARQGGRPRPAIVTRVVITTVYSTTVVTSTSIRLIFRGGTATIFVTLTTPTTVFNGGTRTLLRGVTTVRTVTQTLPQFITTTETQTETELEVETETETLTISASPGAGPEITATETQLLTLSDGGTSILTTTETQTLLLPAPPSSAQATTVFITAAPSIETVFDTVTSIISAGEGSIATFTSTETQTISVSAELGGATTIYITDGGGSVVFITITESIPFGRTITETFISTLEIASGASVVTQTVVQTQTLSNGASFIQDVGSVSTLTITLPGSLSISTVTTSVDRLGGSAIESSTNSDGLSTGTTAISPTSLDIPIPLPGSLITIVETQTVTSTISLSGGADVPTFTETQIITTTLSFSGGTDLPTLTETQVVTSLLSFSGGTDIPTITITSFSVETITSPLSASFFTITETQTASDGGQGFTQTQTETQTITAFLSGSVPAVGSTESNDISQTLITFPSDSSSSLLSGGDQGFTVTQVYTVTQIANASPSTITTTEYLDATAQETQTVTDEETTSILTPGQAVVLTEIWSKGQNATIISGNPGQWQTFTTTVSICGEGAIQISTETLGPIATTTVQASWQPDQTQFLTEFVTVTETRYEGSVITEVQTYTTTMLGDGSQVSTGDMASPTGVADKDRVLSSFFQGRRLSLCTPFLGFGAPTISIYVATEALSSSTVYTTVTPSAGFDSQVTVVVTSTSTIQSVQKIFNVKRDVPATLPYSVLEPLPTAATPGLSKNEKRQDSGPGAVAGVSDDDVSSFCSSMVLTTTAVVVATSYVDNTIITFTSTAAPIAASLTITATSIQTITACAPIETGTPSTDAPFYLMIYPVPWGNEVQYLTLWESNPWVTSDLNCASNWTLDSQFPEVPNLLSVYNGIYPYNNEFNQPLWAIQGAAKEISMYGMQLGINNIKRGSYYYEAWNMDEDGVFTAKRTLLSSGVTWQSATYQPLLFQICVAPDGRYGTRYGGWAPYLAAGVSMFSGCQQVNLRWAGRPGGF